MDSSLGLTRFSGRLLLNHPCSRRFASTFSRPSRGPYLQPLLHHPDLGHNAAICVIRIDADNIQSRELIGHRSEESERTPCPLRFGRNRNMLDEEHLGACVIRCGWKRLSSPVRAGADRPAVTWTRTVNSSTFPRNVGAACCNIAPADTDQTPSATAPTRHVVCSLKAAAILG